MGKSLSVFFVLCIILSIAFPMTAFAAGGLAAIQAAADGLEMAQAIGETSELADESALLEALDAETKASLLDSVYRRRNHCEDIAEFKEMFAEQYEKKTTYMSWESGYPYITDVGDNGATLVVKTDMDGWVYIAAFGDDVSGGLSDEYSFMKFYNADNGVYKKKVWVQGGIETKIGISCGSWASGNTYRAYYCLRTSGNESGFGEAKYQVNKFWYDFKMLRSGLIYEEGIYYYDYYFYLTSDYILLYESYHEFPSYYGFYDYYYWDIYTDTGNRIWIDYEYSADYEGTNYVYTRITNTLGDEFYEDFELPGPLYSSD